MTEELGLKVEDAGLGQGVGAEKFRYGRAFVAQVRIGNLNLTNIEFEVISFADSRQVFGGKPEDGIIGCPFLSKRL